MKIYCVKDVKRNEIIRFRKGYVYYAVIFEDELRALNEQGHSHILFSSRDPHGWKWFYKHFA
jgi:hypothetical protein